MKPGIHIVAPLVLTLAAVAALAPFTGARVSSKPHPARGPATEFYLVHRSAPTAELQGQVDGTDLIVVGLVTGIELETHWLRGTTDLSAPPSRVYTLAVTQILKQSGSLASTLSAPCSIKVLQSSGATLAGVTYRVEGDPFLQVGDRYLLFLRDFSGNFADLGYVPGETPDISGTSAQLDEFLLNDTRQGAVLLRGGVTFPGEDDLQVAEPELFADGPQIFNVPEGDAIQAVLGCL
jgi:hypothetical protein